MIHAVPKMLKENTPSQDDRTKKLEKSCVKTSLHWPLMNVSFINTTVLIATDFKNWRILLRLNEWLCFEIELRRTAFASIYRLLLVKFCHLVRSMTPFYTTRQNGWWFIKPLTMCNYLTNKNCLNSAFTMWKSVHVNRCFHYQIKLIFLGVQTVIQPSK